jgi:hypothetical protein
LKERKTMSKNKQRPTFDPKKNYKWEPTDTFEVSGQQYATLWHLLSQEWNNPSGAPLSLKAEAYEVVMTIFKDAVGEGLIVEADMALVSEKEEDDVKKLFKVK